MNREALEELERFRAEVERLCAETGLTPTRLAKIAKVAASTVNKVMDRTKTPTHVPKLTTLNKLRVAAEKYRQHNHQRGIRSTPIETVARTVSAPARDLPIRAARNDQTGRLMYREGNRHYGLANRPGALIGVEDAYAVRIIDDANSPRYEVGWIAHVNPSLPVVANEDAFVRLHDDTGIVGRVRSISATGFVVSQYNRSERIQLRHESVKTIHRITGSDQVPG